MPIPLGILAAAGARQAAGATFQLLESTVLTGSQASVEFTNLTTKYAATYQHLQLRYVVRSDSSNGFEEISFVFNPSTGGTYRAHGLIANGSSVFSIDAIANQFATYSAVGNGAASGSYGAGVMDILDPFETSKNTTARALGGRLTSGANGVGLGSGAWFNTESISTIRMSPIYASNWIQGTRFSLYGIKATA